MSKLKILIYGNVYDTAVGQSISYMEFFSQFGDVVIATSEMNLDWLMEITDVLALPGGMDVLNNKVKPGFHAGKAHPHYEYLDENLLMPWLKTGKPIIGICRGMQVLNVRMGGTLHRHVNGHVQADKLARSERPDLMFTVFKDEPVYKINSYHHQGVHEMAPGFKALGWGNLFLGCPSLKYVKFFEQGYSVKWKSKNSLDEDTYEKENHTRPMIVELMKHETLPYIGFQYHPEEFMCELATKLINEMLDTYELSKT